MKKKLRNYLTDWSGSAKPAIKVSWANLVISFSFAPALFLKLKNRNLLKQGLKERIVTLKFIRNLK